MRTIIAPPTARVGPLTPEERADVIEASRLRGKYDTAIDRESAFEILQGRGEGRMGQAGAPTAGGQNGVPEAPASTGGVGGWLGGVLGGLFGGSRGGRQRMSTGELVVRSAVQSAARSVGTQIARAIVRGVLGGMSR